MLLTIFTPTYNRANLLPRLFNSLQNQTKFNFEWVLVDDGSIDDTKNVVSQFQKEAHFPINYIYKENEGKHIAINKGVEEAIGELFFIVDSDDFLIPDASQFIEQYYSEIKNRNDLAGVSFRRGHDSLIPIGSHPNFETIEASSLDFRYKYGIVGDMAEVYKTSVMREFPFPKISGEKFCSEGLIWSRMALKYKMIWTSIIIYIGEYLEGGLTDNSFNTRKNSPQYSTLLYSEMTKMPIPIKSKIKGAINYWRFAKYQKNISFAEKWSKIPSLYSIIAFPISRLIK